MRLKTGDYRHPAERLTLLASVWLAVTLVLLVEAALIALIVVQPLNTVASVVIGAALLGVFNGSIIFVLFRVEPWLGGLKSSAQRAGPSRHPRVHEAFQRAAKRLAVPGTPPIYILPTDDIDSFTISWGVPTIFVSRGLVSRLSDLELRAALGHELGHLKDGHDRLLSLVMMPLRAQLAHPLLLAPFALAGLALRWWADVAEMSADRAAAIAAGGPEPVAQWLTVASSGGAEAESDLDLHRYLTHGTEEAGWQVAREELHLIHPAVARRISEVARFTESRRFTAVLGIVGDLQIRGGDMPQNPGSVGILPHIIIGMLAGIWLAPLTLALTVALGAPQRPAEAPAAAPQVEVFDPDVPLDNPVIDDTIDTSTFRPPEIDAGQIQAVVDLARTHKGEGDLRQARELLEQALRADPGHVEAHYLLAWVHVDAGNRNLARGEFIATINLAEPGSEMHAEALAALERLE